MRFDPASLVILSLSIAACSSDGATGTDLHIFSSAANGFVELDKSSRFVDSMTYSLQGVRNPSGTCSWVGERHLKPGQRVAERLAAYNPTTCELVIARGDYTPRLRIEEHSRTELLPRSTAFSACGSNPLDCNGDPDRCEPKSVDFGRAWQLLEYLDPADIETTQDQVDMSWNYNFQCVGDMHGDHYMFWRTGTGWNIQSWRTSATYDFRLYWVRGEGYSYYENHSFPACFGSSVYANHRQNWVVGYSDGGASFNYAIDVTGASCKQLLHVHIVQETPA